MKKVFCILYQIFIFLPVLVPATILTATLTAVGCMLGCKKFWGYVPPKYWSKLACRMALNRVNVINNANLDPNQSYIFAANHQGAFDIFLIYGYLGHNIKWVQKQELRKIPFVGKASEIAGHVFVDQSSLKSMKETIRKAKEQLSDGVSMAIFPEGSRTKNGKIGRLKKGAFIIAKEMGLPVVPVTVNGPFDVMKIHTYFFNPGKLELVIHKPLPTAGITDEELPELMEACKNSIHSGLWEKYK